MCMRGGCTSKGNECFTCNEGDHRFRNYREERKEEGGGERRRVIKDNNYK